MTAKPAQADSHAGHGQASPQRPDPHAGNSMQEPQAPASPAAHAPGQSSNPQAGHAMPSLPQTQDQTVAPPQPAALAGPEPAEHTHSDTHSVTRKKKRNNNKK